METKRISRQSLAWVILLGAFAVFCLLVYSTAMLVTNYLSQSTEFKTGIVQPVQDRDANVFLLRPGQAKETLVTAQETIQEGDEVRTDKSSEAVINLFDGSRLSLTAGSRIRLQQSRIEIRNFLLSEKQIVVQILDGLVTYNAVPFVPAKDYNKSTVKLLLPSEANLIPVEVIFNDPETASYVEGSCVFSVNRSPENGLRIWLNSKAKKALDVRGANKMVLLQPGQRLLVEGNQVGEPGLPAERQVNLVENGSFINGTDYWRYETDQGSDRGTSNGQVRYGASRIDDGAQPLAHIYRLDSTSAGNYAESSLVQEINRDVSEYEELLFSVKIKLIYQSLAGGGQLGAEYPFFVKIYYLDKANNQQEFFKGFYSKALDSSSQVQDQLGRSQKLLQDDWYEFNINLVNARNRPTRILKVIVGAAGHLYDSYFTDISLIAR